MRLGLHWLGEAHECERSALDEPDRVSAFLTDLATILDLTLMEAPRVHPVRGGLAGVVLLGESHAAIHTDVGRATAVVDVFSCTTLDGARAESFVRERLGAAVLKARIVER